MTLRGRAIAALVAGPLALGSAQAQAPAVPTGTPAPAAPYQDRLIEGLPPLPVTDASEERDRSGWPRYLRLETRLGTQPFDAERRARLAYGLYGLIETPNHGVLSVDGAVTPQPRQQTLTLRQRELPLPGGWTGQHELGVISAPATDLARLPARVLLPTSTLRGLGGEWDQAGQGLQLVAGGGEPGQLVSLPAAGFNGLGGRRAVVGAQWHPGQDDGTVGSGNNTASVFASVARAANTLPGWTVALQHEQASNVLAPSTLDTPPDSRTDASGTYLALRHEGDGRRTQAQAIHTTERGRSAAQGFWLDSGWDDGPREYGLSLYRLDPGLSWAGQAMPADLQGVTARTSWRTRQWSADISYDWLRSVSARIGSGSYLTGSSRWRIDRDNTLNAGLSVRRYSGQAWAAYSDWRRLNDWGQSGLRLDLAGGADNQSPAQALTYDQDWTLPLGWTLASSLSAGRYELAHGGSDPFWGAALAWQAPLGHQAELRGQVSTEQRQNGQHRRNLSLGGQWRITRHWGLDGQYTRAIGRTPVERPLDPLAPIVSDTTTSSDRSFQVVLRYEQDAGSRLVPLGGRAQAGGGRIEGVVYFDANDSGTQEASETGAPGVTVALDNRYAVRTDAQGRFSFPFVASGPRTVSVRNDSLPLPWSVVDDGQVKIDVRLRETTTLSLPIRRPR